MPKTPIPLPQVRTVGLMQPMTWLVLAWRDMARSGWISFAHGLAITAFGGAILAVAHHRFWLLAGALSGFLVVAPVLATSLYALSRALEQRQEANLGVVLKTWLNWQNSHFNKWGNDYWCMVQFGALLALAATGWACRVLSSRVTLARRLISSSTKNTVPYTVLGVPQRPQAVGVLTGVCVSSLTKPHLLQR